MKTATLPKVAPSKWDGADRAFQKGQQAYIEFGRELAKIKDSTQAEIGERYGMAKSAVNMVLAVGAERKFSNTKLLPKSTYSLYLLTTLDDEDLKIVGNFHALSELLIEQNAGISEYLSSHAAKIAAQAKALK